MTINLIYVNINIKWKYQKLSWKTNISNYITTILRIRYRKLKIEIQEICNYYNLKKINFFAQKKSCHIIDFFSILLAKEPP